MAKPNKSPGRKKQKGTLERRPYLLWSILIPLTLVIAIVCCYGEISYYLRTFFIVTDVATKEQNKYDARNTFLMARHADNTFGIDVSEYQGKVLWDSVALINEQFPVDFVFIRATMGVNGKDRKFAHNWASVRRISRLRGAYHYFRPNENSIRQAENFIKTVRLRPGDLPPVLDIEERPRTQSMDSLRVGLKRWLDRVEKHYQMRPIVYSGDSYFTDFLEEEFGDYTLWIANYNMWVEKPKKHWSLWQFSDRGRVKGIKGFVDLNMFNGSIEAMEALCVPYD